MKWINDRDRNTAAFSINKAFSVISWTLWGSKIRKPYLIIGQQAILRLKGQDRGYSETDGSFPFR